MRFSLRGLLLVVLAAGLAFGAVANSSVDLVRAAASIALFTSVITAIGIVIGKHDAKAPAAIGFVVGVLAFIGSKYLPSAFSIADTSFVLVDYLRPTRSDLFALPHEIQLLSAFAAGGWTAVVAHWSYRYAVSNRDEAA